eukprot:7952583-Alexandrium_andersonii.AAC.1
MHLRTAHSDTVPLGSLSYSAGGGAIPRIRWLQPGADAGRETILWSCEHCAARLAGPDGAPR